MYRQSQSETRLRLRPGFIPYGELLSFKTLRTLTEFPEYEAALERLEEE